MSTAFNYFLQMTSSRELQTYGCVVLDCEVTEHDQTMSESDGVLTAVDCSGYSKTAYVTQPVLTRTTVCPEECPHRL